MARPADRPPTIRGLGCAWLIASALGATAPAAAQTIYKCKAPDGRITYSNLACAGEGGALSGPGASRPTVTRAPPEPNGIAPSPARAPLPRQCDNGAALRAVVTRLDNPRTPDDVRSFLASERFRLVRCEFTRLTPDERRTRDAAMAQVDSADPALRQGAVRRIEALYGRYLTSADRMARVSRER